MSQLTLVAHRGYPLAFPENTLVGFEQAAVLGATHVEADVQCTRDGVPVLYHDRDTQRLSKAWGSICKRTFEQLGELRVHSPGHLEGALIPTLKAFAGWLAGHPAVTAFIEIKKESPETFGAGPVVEAVMDALQGVEERCVIISFNDQCVEHAAKHYGTRTGWILPEWSAIAESRAHLLSPDYLFVKKSRLPKRLEQVWQGPWQWAVYVVNDLAEALGYAEYGIQIIETDAIGDLLAQYRTE